jgi:iron complex outermembrane receptor protein
MLRGQCAQNHFGSRRLSCRYRSRYVLLLISLPAVAGAAPALAALSPNPKNDQLSEVVVTARRFAENQQNVPLSVTTLSSRDLARIGATSITNIAPVTPNLTIEQNTGGLGKSAIVYIRGVGQGDFLPAFEPGVGFYMNGVYFPSMFGALLNLTDVSSVQVLRGPQGTLFGMSNEAGAVLISTPKARGNDTGYVELGYGSYQRHIVRGALDVSLIPHKLFFRVGGGMDTYNGFMTTYDFACLHPSEAGTLPRTVAPSLGNNCSTGTLGGDSARVLNGDLRWLVAQGLEINFRADVMNDDGEPSAEKLVAVDPNNSTLQAYNSQPNLPYGLPFDGRFVTPSPYTSYTSYTNAVTGQSWPRVSNVNTWGTSITVDWDLPGGDHLKDIVAYRTYNGQFSEIWGNSPVHIDDNLFNPYHHQFSEELDLTGSSFAKRLDWTAGLYYYNALTELNDFIDIAAANFGFYGVDPVKDQNHSVFLDGILHITPKLALELGTRYTDQSKRYTFNRYVPVPAGAPLETLPGFQNNPSSTALTRRFDYRASLKYQWTPQLMSYVQFATGFKGAGINPRPATIAEVVPFAAETVDSYEAGVKSQWLSNRLRVNLDGYFEDYRNLQLTIPSDLGGVPGNIVSNAGKVYISGVEGEIDAEPIHRLLVNASFGSMNYDIRSLGAAAGIPGGPAYGDTAPYVPDWKFHIGVQYGWRIPSGALLTPRLDYAWQARTFNDPSNAAIAEQPAYGLLNGHVTFTSSSGLWQAQVQVKNLTNKFYYSSEYYLYGAFGVLEGMPAMPRTYLLTLKRSF